MPKFKAGERYRYDGIMEPRRGQEVEVRGQGGFMVAARFPDGETIGVNGAYLKATA